MAEPRKRAAKRAPARRRGGDSGGDGVPEPRDEQGRLSVIVELRGGPGMSATFAATDLRATTTAAGFEIDEEFAPVPMGAAAVPGLGFSAGASSFAVRATVDDESAIDEIQRRPDVIAVWRDTPIAPFQCPIPPCDCNFNTPHGTIADVANYLGVPQLWSAGYRGAGMVVGVVDGGITAQGRPVKPGETARRIPRVIGGWPTADWGTEASRWNEHGNMCSTDVLGMAPDAQIYDLRISGAPTIPSTISRALQAFQWAIDQHRIDGTPQVLSNSWGIYQESWDASYARDANHPFTRKMVEALDEGIIVLFAAGNCGGTCPDGRCGADNGPGRSIWGANSHPRVMTVGAVNRDEQFVGYSSQGPGALDPNKPDFCSVTHFTGYFPSDNGTSAATPILAGAVALLKQAKPSATQDAIKGALRATAKDIGPAGFDQHSGAGIVRPKAAFDRLMIPTIPTPSHVMPCLPSSMTPCLPSTRGVVCRPSVIMVCRPSVFTPCLQRTRPPICVFPTRPPGCLQPTRVCPSIVCRSIACVPGPGHGQEWAGAEDWEAAGGYDQASETWYGYGVEGDWSDEEHWYGQ